MKKVYLILLTFLIIFTNTAVFADEIEQEEYTDIIWEEALDVSTDITKEPKINSRAAIVIDLDTKTVLYEKNAYTKRAMASTTKIMTSLITLQEGDLNKQITVSKSAAAIGGSVLGIKAGDKITLKDLLYGLMLKSGNDCAVQIAEEIGGSVEGFAELMNKKAKELNLKNTHFVTPHGLDKPEHYTTAYELALLTQYAMSVPEFRKIVNTKTYTITRNGYPQEISNTNELLGVLNGVNGVKTGFTNNAGRCLVTSVKRNDMQIICVVLGADTKKDRTKDSIKLIEYVYANYKKKGIQEQITEEFTNWKNINQKRIEIYKGIKNYPEVYLEQMPYSELPLKEQDKITVEIESEFKLEAPVFKDTNIGKMNVKLNDKDLFSLNIKVKEDVRKKQVIDYFIELVCELKYYLPTSNI